MTSSEPDSARFEALSRELLNSGKSVRFEARGASMAPSIRDGEIVHVTPVIVSKLRKGDIVLTKGDREFLLHRVVVTQHDENFFITRGDCGKQNDPPVSGDQVLGIVVAKEIRFGKKIVRMKLTGFSGKLFRSVARGRSLAGRLAHAAGLRWSSRSTHGDPLKSFAFLGLLLLLLTASHSQAQVAVDTQPSTTVAAELTGPGTQTLNFNHRTGVGGINRLLVVGVSLNIANDSTATVTGVTYNGLALTQAGAHNDAGNTRRAEIWYLLAPTTGNHAVVVSVNVPGALTIGAVAGAATFTGVDQTVPLGTFVSADGANGVNSQLDVPSVVNGMVIDTLATGGNQTVTIPGPQVSQWNNASGGASPPDVTGTGSTRTGAPSVPISETFNGTSNWSLGAVSINPTAADIGVTTTVGSAVFLGQNTTYTITIFNNGTSTASAVSLSDTLAAGMTLVSATPSVGTCVTTNNPITCAIGTLAGGTNATVTVVETASASGSYANTAVVSDSGTPPDPNTANNTFVAVATVQAIACGNTSLATAGNNLTGVLNTYYPGTANVAAGATQIPVGAATGAGTAIAAGSLLLVIQMQDASINDSNSVAYGNGFTGQGFTALNSAGDYEFVTATGPIAAGSVPIAGAGAGGGLVFAYHAAAASTTAGQSTYQVIVVPQYTTASFNSATPPTALTWNGSTGGVLALDSSNTLTLNGANVSVNGLGFRGGAGLQLNGGVGGNNTDYLHAAPAAYTGVVENGVDALKGEGIAGTPLWVESAGTYSKATSDYPSGAAADGSSGRGAPGNAGGGGTDGDPTANDQNAGG
ncbi:MAG: S24 family peptidase, partial [Candidatus Sulfotelmatobacter sp.]